MEEGKEVRVTYDLGGDYHIHGVVGLVFGLGSESWAEKHKKRFTDGKCRGRGLQGEERLALYLSEGATDGASSARRRRRVAL